MMLIKENKYFFDRTVIDLKSYKEYSKITSLLLNKENILNFNIKKNKLYSENEFDFFLKYVLNTIKKWILKNEFLSYSYISRLKKIITKFDLFDKLNNVEKSYLYLIESIIFNKNRNLKNISSEFILYKNYRKFFLKKEDIFYYFDNIDVKIFNNDTYKKINFLISSDHIIFLFNGNFLKIPFIKISSYKLKLPNQIIFEYNEKQISVFSDEIESIYVSFERVFYGKKTSRKNK